MGAWRVLAAALALLLAACVQACSSRAKHLLGAPVRVSSDDPEVQKAVHFALTEYNKASDDMFASKVMRILSAERQIVSGVKYILEVELGRTQCKQGEFHDLETCDFSAPPHNVKDQQQIAQNVEDRPLERKVDTSNTELQSIIAFAIQEFNKKSSFIYKIVQYLKADVQAVEGSVYVFDIILGKTDCPVVKNAKPESNCQIIQTDGQAENVKDQQQIAQNMEERPLEMNVDSSNTKLQSIVAFAIQEFNKKSSFIFELVQSLKADVKVFDGTIYILDIVLGKTDCPVVKSAKPEANCQIIWTKGQAEFNLCHFIMWQAPDSEEKRMLSSNCKKLDL